MNTNAPQSHPSLAPSEDPAKRPCPHCGAQNPLSAAFCWQCLTRLVGGATPAATSGGSALTPFARPGVTNAYDTGDRPAQTKRNDPVLRVVRAAVPLVILAVGGFLVWKAF